MPLATPTPPDTIRDPDVEETETASERRWSIQDVDEVPEFELVEDSEEPADGDLHVEPDGDHWWIRMEGSETVVARWPTQALAVTSARMLAPETGARIVLHGADGAVMKIWRPRS